MQLLSEFRYPTRWYSKLIVASLALLFFAVLAEAIIAAYRVYGIVIVKPVGSDAAANLTIFPGHPENISYEVDGVGQRDGWFFPGLKLAPTILLCPGYQASRGEFLPLAVALQGHRYNVFLFDFDSHGSTPGVSTLGFREVAELHSALDVLAQRGDVDPSRFGLWGPNMGAYAALSVAEADPRVRALALESVYDRPQDMMRLLATRDGLDSLPLLSRFTEESFLWLNYRSRETPPLSENLSRLANVPKLFLETADEPDLLDSTHRLFVLSPEPKEEAVLPEGDYAGMLDDQKRSYENRLSSFFLLNLPLEMPTHR